MCDLSSKVKLDICNIRCERMFTTEICRLNRVTSKKTQKQEKEERRREYKEEEQDEEEEQENR